LFRAVEKGGHGKTLTKLKLTGLKEKRLIKEISLCSLPQNGEENEVVYLDAQRTFERKS
jgi:hypothetical protein